MRFCLFISLFLVGCNLSPLSGHKVALDVNGNKLTAGEFAREMALRLKDQDALAAKDPKTVDQTKQRIVEDFIVQSLSNQWAKQNNLIVKTEELEEQIQKVKANYPDDLAFQQTLANEGVPFKEWREKMQATLLQKLVVKKISETAAPPADAEIKNYYENNRTQFVIREAAQVRQILLSSEGDAKSIETELRKGKSLSSLAKKYSLSPEGAQGGDVGWVEKGLSDIFEPAVKMRIGQRSNIVKSAYGYHIYEVTAHRAGRPKTLNEVKEEIRRILVEKKQQDLYLSWLDEQTRKARIFKNQELIAALKVETKIR